MINTFGPRSVNHGGEPSGIARLPVTDARHAAGKRHPENALIPHGTMVHAPRSPASILGNLPRLVHPYE